MFIDKCQKIAKTFWNNLWALEWQRAGVGLTGAPPKSPPTLNELTLGILTAGQWMFQNKDPGTRPVSLDGGRVMPKVVGNIYGRD